MQICTRIRVYPKMDGSVSGAAAASPEGQEQIADAVQQTTGFSPPSEPAEAPHPALREDQIQNAVAFLAHPKVIRPPFCHTLSMTQST